MFSRQTTCGALIGCLLLPLTQSAQAAGFYISEVGTPGSLGTAGVANTTNTMSADAAWTNPAGMTGVQQDEILAGFQLLVPKIEFDPSVAEKGGKDGGNAGNLAAIPSFFMVKKLSDRLSMGFSLVAPQGGAMNYGDDFVGRYAASRVSLAAIGASPSIGYKLNDRLSLGAGVSIVYTQFEQSIAINRGAMPDGKVRFDNMDDIGYQPFAGLTYHLSDRLMLGLVYRAEMDVELEGDLNFRNLDNRPPANDIEIDWDNPQTLRAGLRYELDPGRRLVFSANWEDWSTFSENQLAFSSGAVNPTAVLDRKFKDTWSAGVAFLDMSRKTRGYSLGFSYDSSPVSDNNRTIDLPFDETYKLSAAYAWTGKKNLDFGVGGTLLYFGEGKTDQTMQGVRFKGEFDTNMALFLGGTLRYLF
jgi:long-chain fatty acid transport protein